jgi:putative ABC transport system substrate-binding protein
MVLWASGGRAQENRLPVIGFLSLAAPEAFAHLLEAYLQGLRNAGFVEGDTVTIEYRWAHGQYDQLPSLAADLVTREVDVIVSSGGDRPSLAVKDATSTIPVVFVGSDDPVGLGLVKSLSHPAGNMTGGSLFTSELEVKKLELLNEMVPGAKRIGMLANPNNPAAKSDIEKVDAAARARNKELQVVEATSNEEIDTALASLEGRQLGGLVVGHDPLFNSRREQIVALVNKLSLPAIYEHREFVSAGGLMSYGSDIAENYRKAAEYTARILRGAAPAELPVQQATKFLLTINLKAAKGLGLDFPAPMLVRADEVFE